MKSRTETELDLKWASLNKVGEVTPDRVSTEEPGQESRGCMRFSFSEDGKGKQKENLEFIHRSKRKRVRKKSPKSGQK